MGRAFLATVSIVVVLIMAGCAGGPSAQPNLPDENPLAPAEQALAEARNIGAAEFAPQALSEARRKLGVARGVLYEAAAANRAISEVESARIQRLTEEARLDARLAYVKTQEAAVVRKVAELRGENELDQGDR